MHDWFPALRDYLARLPLPRPYPHFLKTLEGSALATVLTAALLATGYLVWTAVKTTVVITEEVTSTSSHVLKEGMDLTTDIVSSSADGVTIASDATESVINNIGTTISGFAAGLVRGASKSVTETSYDLEDFFLPTQETRLREMPSTTFTWISNKAKDNIRTTVNRHTLPWLEKPDAPLTDIIKQIDFALLQTILRLKLEEGRVFLANTEIRKQHNESYFFQRLKIYLPKNSGNDAPATFSQLFSTTLEVWADRAVLTKATPSKIIVAVDNLPTHEIWLETVGEEFLLPPLEDGPRMTIVIDDMGENLHALDALLNLDIPITIAVWPQSQHAEEIAIQTSEAGREVLMHQPMEPMQAPFVDAGLGAITSHTQPDQIRTILLENLHHVPHAAGINNHMGSRFTQDHALTAVVCDVLAESGLFVLDSVTHAQSVLYEEALRRGLPAWRRNVFLDDGKRTVQSVLAELKKAEIIAKKHGQAIAIGHPHPETLQALQQWCVHRDMDIQIVPLRHLRVHREVFKVENNLNQ